jgi:hypothetical protein
MAADVQNVFWADMWSNNRVAGEMPQGMVREKERER